VPDREPTPTPQGEPPWLALYRAETDRLKVLIDLFHDPGLDTDSDFGEELCRVIIDIAGRSAVRDFVPGHLGNPCHDRAPTEERRTVQAPPVAQCDCTSVGRCPLRKAAGTVRCTLTELATEFACTTAQALDRLHAWQARTEQALPPGRTEL